MSPHTARDTLRLALGSPEKEDAAFSLCIIIQALEEQAHALDDGPLAVSLKCRLEALRDFVDEHLTITWRDVEAEQ